MISRVVPISLIHCRGFCRCDCVIRFQTLETMSYWMPCSRITIFNPSSFLHWYDGWSNFEIFRVVLVGILSKKCYFSLDFAGTFWSILPHSCHFLIVYLMLSTIQSAAWLSRINGIAQKFICRGFVVNSQYTQSNEMYRFRSHVPQKKQVFNCFYGLTAQLIRMCRFKKRYFIFTMNSIKHVMTAAGFHLISDFI